MQSPRYILSFSLYSYLIIAVGTQQSGDSLNKTLCKFQLWTHNQTLYNQKQLFLHACILLEFLPKIAAACP